MILFSIAEAVTSLKRSVNEQLLNLLTRRLIRYTILNVVLTSLSATHLNRILLAEHRSYIDRRIKLKYTVLWFSELKYSSGSYRHIMKHRNPQTPDNL
jgi:hypothetical protein